jgi:hypothetical protein
MRDTIKEIHEKLIKNKNVTLISLEKNLDIKPIYRLIRVKLSYNDHEYDILSKSPSLKGSIIYINEVLIPEAMKGSSKGKEATKEGKWKIIRKIKDNVCYRDNFNNKYEFGRHK